MFCYQCQETVKNQGCSIQGVCGKKDDSSNLMDLLIYLLFGLSFWQVESKKLGLKNETISVFIIQALFSTITNVNFDDDRLIVLINKAFDLRDSLKEKFLVKFQEQNKQPFDFNFVPESAYWQPSISSKQTYLAKAKEVGILSIENEDIRSLRYLLIYGLKGISAYLDHAYVLGYTNEKIFDFIENCLAKIGLSNLTAEEYLGLIIETGNFGAETMALLDTANTSTYGKPEITEVFTGTIKGPGILISGHDLRDLAELLEQTKGTDVNIYTHGEMLPANAYPFFKQYGNLIGNFGSSWYNQQKEFAEFKGAILMTTNCIQKPLDTYEDRIFTTGLVAWPGVKHIEDRKNNQPKDFSGLIQKAQELGDLEVKEGKKLTIGFAHDTVLANADKIIEAIKSGAIKRFIVMAGCDGRFKERTYYTEFAEKLPSDTIILTAGCAKYRYNFLDLGTINGIPRVLDAGQCNDSYSLAVIALKLKEVFGLSDLNDLPISFDIAWYEQKAVLVLLMLLSLGFKNIILGPTLPAFISPNVYKIIKEKFNLSSISSVAEDVQKVT